jgi:flagellar capping protein FliD
MSVDFLTSATSGSTQITGLTSDTKWADYVDEVLEAQGYTIDRLEKWRGEWTDKQKVIEGLDVYLQALEMASEDLDEKKEFLARITSSSEETIVTASSENTASPGSHTVVVGENIVHRVASQGWTDTDTTSFVDDDGDMVIQVGDLGTITIDATDLQANATLDGLKDLINY